MVVSLLRTGQRYLAQKNRGKGKDESSSVGWWLETSRLAVCRQTGLCAEMKCRTVAGAQPSSDLFNNVTLSHSSYRVPASAVPAINNGSSVKIYYTCHSS